MSPEERAALNKAIKDRHEAGMKRSSEVTPNALRKFEEQIANYPLQGKAAWLDPHRNKLRDLVVLAFEGGAETMDDMRLMRFRFDKELLTHPQRDQFLRVCTDWLRKLKKLSLVRLSKQLNGPSGKTETSNPLDKYKPL